MTREFRSLAQEPSRKALFSVINLPRLVLIQQLSELNLWSNTDFRGLAACHPLQNKTWASLKLTPMSMRVRRLCPSRTRVYTNIILSKFQVEAMIALFLCWDPSSELLNGMGLLHFYCVFIEDFNLFEATTPRCICRPGTNFQNVESCSILAQCLQKRCISVEIWHFMYLCKKGGVEIKSASLVVHEIEIRFLVVHREDKRMSSYNISTIYCKLQNKKRGR